MRRTTLLLAVLACIFPPCQSLWAAPTTAGDAELVVAGWLRLHAIPLGTPLGQQVTRVETFRNESGTPIYYIVYLEPSGYVIVSADDQVEPIIGFAAQGVYTTMPDDPVGTLVTSDLSARIAAVQSKSPRAPLAIQSAGSPAQEKWMSLWSVPQTPPGELSIAGSTSIDDVRVEPLIKSTWEQTTKVCNNYCYNLYTPRNYAAGCAAIAMAQVMRYHQWPDTPFLGNPPTSFSIKVDGVSEFRNLLGGDGTGGAYQWALMDLRPDCSTSQAGREAIGALCYDAGIASGMKYAAAGSGTTLEKTRDALLQTFRYSNGIIGIIGRSSDDLIFLSGTMEGMINPNLDAGLPVMVSLFRSTDDKAGHGPIVDGYGYDGFQSMYHHLNMGWAGTYDLWYNLPNVDSGSPGPYKVLAACLYNLFAPADYFDSVGDWFIIGPFAVTGEIISGRVIDKATGRPIGGAAVVGTLTPFIPTWRDSTNAWCGRTNNKGIYGLVGVPSGTTCYVSVLADNYMVAQQLVTVGTSKDGASTSGNRWGVDFAGIPLISTVTISGRVATEGSWQASSVGIPGVTVRGEPGGYSATTDASGSYSLTVSYGWTGTITASLPGCTFDPSSSVLPSVTSNQTLDFTVFLDPIWSIVGTWWLQYDWDGAAMPTTTSITFKSNGAFATSQHEGGWSQTGNSVTWRYYTGTVYTGTLSSPTRMSGSMRDDRGFERGKWNATRN